MQSVTGTRRVVAGRYQLLDRIGHGSVGTVWRAADLPAGSEVAIKEVQVPAFMTEQDRKILHERSLREARVTARLSHPAIVTVHDVIEAEGNLWIVMELVPGASLATILAREGPVAASRAAGMGGMLLAALASAHAAGIVHRDVKPANVLVTEDERVVLTDFGIATLEGDPCLTQAGMVMGTPGFCAPERIRGKPASPASDLWSLGATLFAAVEGHGPFDGAGSPMAVLASIVHGELPPPRFAGPLAPVISALMSREPAQRPDATAVARLLAEVAGQAPRRTGAARAGVPAGPAAAAAFPTDATADAPAGLPAAGTMGMLAARPGRHRRDRIRRAFGPRR